MIQILWMVLIVALQLNTDYIEAIYEDEWLDKPPEFKFEAKNYYRVVFTKEDNVSWNIAGDLRTIQVTRTAWVYALDQTVTHLAIKYDHLKNVKLSIQSRGLKVQWPFYYENEYLIVEAKDKLLNRVYIAMVGYLWVNTEGTFQVGFSVDEDTQQR